tara:strand:+ start:13476 stop:14852 length:1377 start_codon:yes stop_codon:yes gene_type:complete
MRGHNQAVKFSEDEPLKCRHVDIPFGPGQQLSLSIEATLEELDTLFHIITQLKRLSIRLRALSTNTIEQLIEQTQQLLTLNCMAPHQAYIHTSIRHAFFHVIHLKPSLPKTQDIESLDVKIALINLELNHIGAINTYSEFTRPKRCKPYALYLIQLPQTLPEFIRSIDITLPERLSTWEGHLSTLPIDALRSYLANVTASVQQLTDEHEVSSILGKLNQFVTYLNKGGHRIQHDMFAEVAIHGNRSPLRSPHATHEKILKHQLNKLLASDKTTFHHDFLAFRQALSKANGTPYVQLNKLMRSLHFHVLATLDESSLPRTAHTNIVERYMYRCFSRTKNPLPEHLQSELDHLLWVYNAHNGPASLRDRYKLEFLNRLSHTIHLYPEKTYAECYRSTIASSNIEIQILMTEKSCSFFAKHRFKHFITGLLSEEPDYERPALSQNAYLNNPSYDGASRFLC